MPYIIQSEVSQKEKDQYSILTHIYGIKKDGNNNPICKTEKETQMYRTDFWNLWEKARGTDLLKEVPIIFITSTIVWPQVNNGGNTAPLINRKLD